MQEANSESAGAWRAIREEARKPRQDIERGAVGESKTELESSRLVTELSFIASCCSFY